MEDKNSQTKSSSDRKPPVTKKGLRAKTKSTKKKQDSEDLNEESPSSLSDIANLKIEELAKQKLEIDKIKNDLERWQERHQIQLFSIIGFIFAVFSFVSINLNFSTALFQGISRDLSEKASPIIAFLLILMCFFILQIFFFVFVWKVIGWLKNILNNKTHSSMEPPIHPPIEEPEKMSRSDIKNLADFYRNYEKFVKNWNRDKNS